MTEEKTEDIRNNKDITDELLDFEVSDDDRPVGGAAPPEERGDHPGLALLDMALSTGADFAKKERLPPPNMKVYEGFSRPFLNEALWHYVPDADMLDDPRICLVAGIAGLALACGPTLIALHERRSAPPPVEEKTGEKAEEKTEKRIVNPVTGSVYPVADRAVSPPVPKANPAPAPLPAWMDKIASGSDPLPGQ